MHTLTKHSTPGYTKGFYAEDNLRRVLYKSICLDCLDSHGTSLEGMLQSSCGMEYSVKFSDGKYWVYEDYEDYA